MEYLFKKDELQAVIDGSSGSEYISIKLEFKSGAGEKEFTAEITASGYPKDASATAQAAGTTATTAKGCPNPPGCA